MVTSSWKQILTPFLKERITNSPSELYFSIMYHGFFSFIYFSSLANESSIFFNKNKKLQNIFLSLYIFVWQIFFLVDKLCVLCVFSFLPFFNIKIPLFQVAHLYWSDHHYFNYGFHFYTLLWSWPNKNSLMRKKRKKEKVSKKQLSSHVIRFLITKH